MKTCPSCHQRLGEQVAVCPSCGQQVEGNLDAIDGYHIERVLKDSYGSLLCQARRQETGQRYTLRIFKPEARLTQEIVDRLQAELKTLQQLPGDDFVAHHAINRASDGTWYRVSEWVDAANWGNLMTSGKLDHLAALVGIFGQIAEKLDKLHRMGHFLPHLILDDILVHEGKRKAFKVKIDYKLSRFLTPQLARPGATLQKLLATHPDIQKKRALDQRSDIWSLGKLFVELLTKNPDRIDYQAQINELVLPHEMEDLLRLMLSDDPGKRPQSMAEVVAVLARVKKRRVLRQVKKQQGRRAFGLELAGLKQRITLLAVFIMVITVLGGLSLYHMSMKKQDSAAKLSDIARRYAPSVAFVMSEYSLTNDSGVFYHQRAEGTAFLVDTDGYLLTNRHVACPWLEDNELYAVIGQLQQLGVKAELKYRIYLWFEGRKAFKRLPGLSESSDIEDVYNIDTAFSTESQPRLTIVGVGRSPTKTYQQVRSPLKDDFAVLKIDKIPTGLEVLPLVPQKGRQKIARLAPIIALGFPLGSKTQETAVNVSVTRGHVRRNFENVMQVDTSIYKGNSGGPIINQDGNVVGIASRVAVELTDEEEPAATMLSDIGMVLPIAKAAKFVSELKIGHPKWNGVLDLDEDAKISAIVQLASNRHWQEAAKHADQALTNSSSPAVIMVTGMIHFCVQNYHQAQKLMERTLSIDENNVTARMVLYLIDWLKGRVTSSEHAQILRGLDWRSNWELYGRLVRVMEGDISTNRALKGGYNDDERAWLAYIVALMRAKHKLWDKAEVLMQQAVLKADSEGWLFFMALSRLEYFQQKQLSRMRRPADKRGYQRKITAFNQSIQKKISEDRAKAATMSSFPMPATQVGVPMAVRRVIHERMLDLTPTDGDLLHDLAFYSSIEEDWEASLSYIKRFMEMPGRENAHRLSLGLWEPMVLHHIGQASAAQEKLAVFITEIEAPWFLILAEFLMGKQQEAVLLTEAGENPANLFTAYATMGFWAEGLGDKKKALNYYREALGTYMDEWRMYEFVWERIKKIRKEI